MGRGPGKWQTILLGALQKHDGVNAAYYVAAVLGRPLRPAEYSALMRAAHALAAKRKVSIHRVPTLDEAGRAIVSLWVFQPGVSPAECRVPEVRTKYELRQVVKEMAEQRRRVNVEPTVEHLDGPAPVPPRCYRCGELREGEALAGGFGRGDKLLCGGCVEELLRPAFEKMSASERTTILEALSNVWMPRSRCSALGWKGRMLHLTPS